MLYKMISIDIGPVLTPKDIIMPVIVTLAAVFASSLSPALKAAKISPIEGIKENYSIKSKKKMKEKNISEKFSFSFAMALSNVMSNKKRFICTIISFAVSIFMLICSVYIFNVFDPEIAAYRNTGGDILIKYENMNSMLNCGCDEGKLNKIRSIDGIKDMKKHRTFYLNLELAEDKLTTEGSNFYSNKKNKFSSYLPSTYSVGIDNTEFDNLAKYAKEGTIDFRTYDGKPEVIVVQNINYHNYTKYKVGDTVTIYARYIENAGILDFKDTDKVDFKVGAVLSTSPVRPMRG